MTFKNRLREVRKEHGMSVTELGKRTGVSRNCITDIELKGKVPNGDTLLLISRALKMEPTEIFSIE